VLKKTNFYFFVCKSSAKKNETLDKTPFFILNLLQRKNGINKRKEYRKGLTQKFAMLDTLEFFGIEGKFLSRNFLGHSLTA